MSSSDEKIGQILMKQGLITKDDLVEALKAQAAMKARGQRVFKTGELLLFQQKITLPQLQGALYQQTEKVRAARQDTMRSINSSHRAEQKKREKRKQSSTLDEESSVIKSLRSIFRKKKDP